MTILYYTNRIFFQWNSWQFLNLKFGPKFNNEVYNEIVMIYVQDTFSIFIFH